MTCTHTLLGGLVCQRTDRHDPAGRGGHVYESAWLGDGHDTTEASDD